MLESRIHLCVHLWHLCHVALRQNPTPQDRVAVLSRNGNRDIWASHRGCDRIYLLEVPIRPLGARVCVPAYRILEVEFQSRILGLQLGETVGVGGKHCREWSNDGVAAVVAEHQNHSRTHCIRWSYSNLHVGRRLPVTAAGGGKTSEEHWQG